MNEILKRLYDAYHKDRVDEVYFLRQLAEEFAVLHERITSVEKDRQGLATEQDRGEL